MSCTCNKVHCKLLSWRQKLTESKRKRAWSVAQVMVVAYSIQDSLMACSDSCQKQSTQIITWPGQPTKCTVACKIRFSTDDFREWHLELRFLSNGVSWEDALRATKSGRFEECGCGKSWKKSSTAWWIWRTAVDFYWCVDSENQSIKCHTFCVFMLALPPIRPEVVRSLWLLVSERQLWRDALSPYHSLSL